IARVRQLFDCFEERMHRFPRRSLTWHVDICCLLVYLINDFYIDAGASRNAHETIINAFGCKELFEDIDIRLAKIPCHSDVMAVVCQECSNIDPFATSIKPDLLGSIDAIWPEVINSHCLVDCRVKRNCCYLHEHCTY